MTEAANSSFVYVTYIRTTPEKLWAALTTPEFIKKYWFGMNIETDWKAGAPWKLVFPDGRIADAGEIVEFYKPKRMVLRWRHQLRPELHEEGYARCIIETEPAGEVVKLTITHEIDKPGSKLIGAVSIGWPKILSSLKTLLETGTARRQLAKCRAAENKPMTRKLQKNGCTAVVACFRDAPYGRSSEFVKKSGAGLGETHITPRFPGESRDLSLRWRFAASNRNALPAEEEFVRPTMGPGLRRGSE